ncbi:prefoldin subunit 4 [Folsomia candida]|uniref:prefoldin subunit 4 n=1 Tax=Folsomia candida TaxID=158441 RepID=UPI000B8FC825|nr:prefoldin subunit 4 [Folsomia candida]
MNSMMPNLGKKATGGQPSDTDVNITKENQKKINQFAIRNGWLDELKDELKAKQNLLKNLEDASDEVTLLDDDVPVPILIGESFVHFDQERGLEQISILQSTIRSQISTIEAKIATIKSEMSGLKQQLYSQFGDSINLECEEEL